VQAAVPRIIFHVMQKPKLSIGAMVLIAVLAVFLAVALIYAASAWTAMSGPPLPTVGYVAMGLGVLFSLLIGCGLMALVFYSSRHGYDEPSHADDERS
jgi:hypothetical protein